MQKKNLLEVDKTMLTYTQLLNQTLEQYINNGPLAAYNFIEDKYASVDGIEAQIYNFRYSLASAAGLKEQALELFEEAVIQKKYWYTEEYLNSDDDLDLIRDHATFLKCKELCILREQASKEAANYIYREHPAIDATLDEQHFIAFHGNQENMAYTIPYWTGKAISKYNKVFPQSPSIEFSDGYSWNDDIEKYTEISKHLNKYKQYILGGFSAGGHAAFHYAFEYPNRTKGIILVAPWLPGLGKFKEKLPLLKAYNIPIYVICGDQDEDCLECTTELIKELDQENVSFIYKEVPELSHEYPEDFSNYLDEAIGFIENFKHQASSKDFECLHQDHPFEGYYDVLQTIRKTINTIKVDSILDIGLGTYVLSKQLYDQGYEITGITTSEDHLSKAQQAMPKAQFHLQESIGELSEVIFRNTYDVIVSTFKLHELTDCSKVATIEKLYQQLSYGGVILIADISFDSRNCMEKCKVVSDNCWNTDGHYFTFDTFSDTLEAIGLSATFQQVSTCAGVLKIIKV